MAGKLNPALTLATLICAAIALGFAGAALWLLTIPNGWIASMIFAPFAAVMAWLTRASWRQARGMPDPDLLRPEGNALFWQGSKARAWGSFVGAAGIGLLALGIGAALIGTVMAVDIGWGARIAICAMLAVLLLLFGGLAQLLWRNGKGFHKARIALTPDGLQLKLPHWRSLIHRPAPIVTTLRWAEVAGIATRLEGYAPQGMAMMQRPYWLLRHDAEPILLFEDRGIDSPQETRSLEPVARAIAERAGGQWIELPMAEGRGGLLGAWFTAPPPDRADPLPPMRIAKLKSRTRLTAEIGGYAFALVMLARVVASLLE